MPLKIQRTADSIASPDGYAVRAQSVSLQISATCALTMSATVFAIVTDSDCWVGGTLLSTPAQANVDSNFLISETAGTVTCLRALNARVHYGFSNITVINGVTRQFKIFGGATGTTAKGGICAVTDLTAYPNHVHGESVFACAVGDIISIKAIESGAGTLTLTQGFLTVEEV